MGVPDDIDVVPADKESRGELRQVRRGGLREAGIREGKERLLSRCCIGQGWKTN